MVNHSALSGLKNEGLKNSKVVILRNEERGKPKKFEDSELQALLDEDDAQTITDQLNVTRETLSIRLKSMGKIQKMRKWIPQLNERQQENRKITCEMLLARYKRKLFLHRIVTGNEKWIYFENPKRKRSWVTPRIIDIDCKAKSLWTEDNALCLMGSERCDLL